MITDKDKAIVALIMAGVSVANVVFGQHVTVNQDAVTAIVAIATPLLVYFVPNKSS